MDITAKEFNDLLKACNVCEKPVYMWLNEIKALLTSSFTHQASRGALSVVGGAHMRT